jgi:hypothetical protein
MTGNCPKTFSKSGTNWLYTRNYAPNMLSFTSFFLFFPPPRNVTTLNLFSKIDFGQFAPPFFGYQVTKITQVTNLFNYATTGRLN